MTDDEPNISDAKRHHAYRKAQSAALTLEEAAHALGADDVHDLTNMARNDELPEDMDAGVRAIGNAYSYLSNGMKEQLLPEEDLE